MVRPWRRAVAAFAAALLLAAAGAGCVNQSVKRVNSVTAKQAERDLPAAELLNVNIAVFDPGVTPENAEANETRVFPEVRDAESRYIPYTLRTTLQGTGQWGAVRVVPEPIASSELLITGEIIGSDGDTLVLRIDAVDATGRTWLDKTYSEQAAKLSYSESSATTADPFQDLYNRIANDLLKVRNDLSVADTRAIQRVSELRFAADLSPESFGRYLAHEGGRYRVTGLPAEGDPMTERMRRIRERDYRLIDALDQHYRVFQQQIEPAYDKWRDASYREIQNLRELRRQSLTRKLLGAAAVIAGVIGGANANSSTGVIAAEGAIIGGAYIFKSGLDKGSESKIHAEALKELGQSLESDVKPRVVELEGQTVTLTGSAQAQYEEWQRLLKQIYASETGFSTSTGDAAQPPADDGS